MVLDSYHGTTSKIVSCAIEGSCIMRISHNRAFYVYQFRRLTFSFYFLLFDNKTVFGGEFSTFDMNRQISK